MFPTPEAAKQSLILAAEKEQMEVSFGNQFDGALYSNYG
jgi:hypothetical protein